MDREKKSSVILNCRVSLPRHALLAILGAA